MERHRRRMTLVEKVLSSAIIFALSCFIAYAIVA
jgi:hypothetical protein